MTCKAGVHELCGTDDLEILQHAGVSAADIVVLLELWGDSSIFER